MNEPAWQSMTKTASKAIISEFLRRAGRKGGKKSAQHPDRKRLNRQAAESRWRKELPAPKIIEK
jgi:predicted Fe-S protein YdhL (DUF1289 family)